MRSTRIKLVLTALISMQSTLVSADFVGINIGLSHWAPELTGNFNSGNDATIDLNSDLGINDPSQTSLVLILEHPVPVLPNIKYQNIG